MFATRSLMSKILYIHSKARVFQVHVIVETLHIKSPIYIQACLTSILYRFCPFKQHHEKHTHPHLAITHTSRSQTPNPPLQKLGNSPGPSLPHKYNRIAHFSHFCKTPHQITMKWPILITHAYFVPPF